MDKHKVLEFLKKKLGEVMVVSYEDKGKYVRIVWKEEESDEDKYFMNIGARGRNNRLVELSGGEA